MRAVSKAAQKVLEKLTAGLEIGGERRVNNAPGAYLPVEVIRRTERLFTVNHWVEVNGDLCMDPGMDFWLGPDGKFYPASITQTLGIQIPTRHAIIFDENEVDKVTHFRPGLMRELCSFATQWMRNIKVQQDL